MEKLRNDFPTMKEADNPVTLLYFRKVFSPQVISLFMKDTVANVYARKSRLKSRIKSAELSIKIVFSSFRIGVRPVLEILEYNPNNILNINTLKNKVLDLQNRIIIQNRCNLSTFAFVKIGKKKRL